MHIITVNSVGTPLTFDANVTPIGGVTKIGPVLGDQEGLSDAQVLNCIPLPLQKSLPSQTIDFSIADSIARGEMDANRRIRVQFRWGPDGTIMHTDPHLLNLAGALTPGQLIVAPAPTCAVGPDQTVCEGSPASFTVTATGTGPFSFCWKKNCSSTPETTGCITANVVSTATTSTLSFPSAQAAEAGCYKVTVTDQFGCSVVCSNTLTVKPNPTCVITGPGTVECVSTPTFTSTVSPPGGTVTHSWSISSAPASCTATIQGSTTGPTVTVAVNCPAGGSFTLVDIISRDGCPGRCETTVTVNPCLPKCTIEKLVACYLPGDTCGTFGPTATGVKDGGVCPAFCYKFIVRNTSTNVPITSLTVVDAIISGDGTAAGDISAQFTVPIAAGDSREVVVKAKTHCVDTVNEVTVTCFSAAGLSDTDTARATALVLNINIECASVLFSSMDMTNGNNTADDCILVLPDSFSGTVDYTLTLRNTGSSGLDITSLSGLPPFVSCDGTTPATIITLPIHLGPGESTNYEGCIQVDCPANINIDVKAHAEASDNGGTLCVYSSTGERIADDSDDNDCNCSITCKQAVTCRVTGGGVLNPGIVDQSCIPVETTILPFIVNGLPVDHISHGGQLGAPFSQMDCGEKLGNPCIAGQWQHTRHYVGKGNPRDVVDMNFHSVTPAKGVWDSLMCACLGCCDPETGAFIPRSVGPLIHKFALCNPDDHKVCGPQPRPAPANAIIFSGVGRIKPVTDTGANEKAAEWLVFRVYIEDRSEPGGFHPNGAVEPSDIYCFQAWRTGILTSKKPNYSAIAPAFRRALGQANCDFLAALESGALSIGSLPSATVDGVTADIQDCGPLDRGNHQIHPSTSATCKDE